MYVYVVLHTNWDDDDDEHEWYVRAVYLDEAKATSELRQEHALPSGKSVTLHSSYCCGIEKVEVIE